MKVGEAEWPQALVVDDENVYALTRALVGAHVVAIPRAGGPSRTLVAATGVYSYSNVETLGQTAQSLLFSRSVAIEQPGPVWLVVSDLMIVPKDGGKPTSFHPLISNKSEVAVRGLAVDATHAFWLEGRGDPTSLPTDRLVRAPLAGGPSTLIAQKLPNAIELVVDGGFAYVTTRGPKPGKGSVLRVALTGGATSVLAADQDDPTDLIVDATHLYWTVGKQLVRLAKGASTPQVVFADFDAVATELRRAYVVDEHHLYWTSTSDEVCRANKDGSDRTRIDDGDHLGPIAVDAKHVFYASGDTIRVLLK